MDANAKKVLKNLQEAQDALDANTEKEHLSGITHETAAYERLNQAVIDAEEAAKAAGVPWWHR